MIAGIAFNAILITEYGNEIPKNVSAVRCNKSDKPVNPPGIRFPARTKDLMLTDISNDAKSTQPVDISGCFHLGDVRTVAGCCFVVFILFSIIKKL